MSNSDVTVDSLYNLSLNKLYSSMDQDTLKYICKCYLPSIVINIIWKLLHINNGNEEFVHNFTLHKDFQLSAERGENVFELTAVFMYPHWRNPEHRQAVDTIYIPNEEIPYDDKYNVCEQFNLDLFFKLVKVTHSRNKLYTIFQICVRKMGYDFPKRFAKEWINMKKEKVDHTIQNGLELGIFLGDTGWLHESTIVLSYTYTKICSKWLFYDKQLKLNQTIQCLTKLLLVTVNFYNFDEAPVILQRIMNTIHIIEKRNETSISLAYAYYAWFWAKKSINVLNEESDSLKLLVISHTIKVCGVTNKIDTGLKLMNRLYKYKKEIDQTVIADIMMNQLYYYLRTKLMYEVIKNGYIVIDIMRNLFGYVNLNTAITFINFLQAHVHFDYESKRPRNIDAAFQAMVILKKLPLPEGNLLTLYTEQMSSILQPLRSFIHNLNDPIITEILKINSNTLQNSIKTVGKNSLFTAKTYCNIAKFFDNLGFLQESETLFLCGIKIKVKILGDESPEVANSLVLLAHLYNKMHKYQETEQICLRCISIYKKLYGPDHERLIEIYLILLHKYRANNQAEERLRYSIMFHDKLLHIVAEISDSEIFDAIHTNSKRGEFSLKEVKCVLNDDINEILIVNQSESVKYYIFRPKYLFILSFFLGLVVLYLCT